MYNDIIPVVHASFHVEKVVSNEEFLKYIYTEARSIWDPYKKMIVKFTENDLDFEKYFFKFPVKKRDFCDRVIVKSLENGLAVISFSDDSVLEPNIAAERGENIMTCIFLERTISGSTVQSLFQIDLKLEIKRNTDLIFAKLFEDWAKLFKKLLSHN